MGFLIELIMNSKSFENCFVWNHQYFEKIAKIKIYVHNSIYWLFIAEP